jgi:hypothetical protein
MDSVQAWYLLSGRDIRNRLVLSINPRTIWRSAGVRKSPAQVVVVDDRPYYRPNKPIKAGGHWTKPTKPLALNIILGSFIHSRHSHYHRHTDNSR